MKFWEKLTQLMLFSLLGWVLLCPQALAAEENGYLFRIDDTVSAEAAALLETAEDVYAPDGIYRTDDADLLEQLQALDAVSFWEEDGIVTLEGNPEDWKDLTTENWSTAIVGLHYAAQQRITGSGIKVGIVDSGLRSDFGDFFSQATILEGTNYMVSEGSTDRENAEDEYGHGTMVASVIADAAPEATILPLKCFDGKTGFYSHIIAAVNGAIDAGCSVINLSFGGTDDNQLLRAAIARALERNIIVVAAGGNLSAGTTSSGADTLLYPAAYSGVIGVGNVDDGKNISSSSVQNASVDIAAPGTGVRVLPRTGSSFGTNSGTSFSSPLVAAAAALARSVQPELTPAAFETLLCTTAEDLGTPGRDNAYGSGLLNVGLLLATLRGDDTSLLPSYCPQSGYCVSAYQPAETEELLGVFAFYDAGGRFLGMRQKEAEDGQLRLCNCPFPAGAASCKLLVVTSADCTPRRQARE